MRHPPVFRFYRPELERPDVLSVDGVVPGGPNFSHWPGNRTPADLRHDLSTGIALAWAALPSDERRERLWGVRVVTNHHFDTDGVLSALVVLRPHEALERCAAMLDAACTGDFQVFTTREALALDLLLSSLRTRGRGPGAEEARYLAAFEAAGAVLFDGEAAHRMLDPEGARRFERLLRALDELPPSVRVRVRPARRFAHLFAPADLPSIVRNTIAGSHPRVLVTAPARGGTLLRYVDRVEGWFDLVSMERPARADLRAVARRLAEREPARGPARWRATAPDVPIPELWFGIEGDGPSFGPTRPGRLLPSRLRAEEVEAELLAALEHADSVDRGEQTLRHAPGP